MYRIQKTKDGAMLSLDDRFITRYEVTETKNTYKVRLIGASFGYTIGYFVPKSVSYDSIISQCARELREIYKMHKGAN
jgi:hypothetical protein